MSFAVEKEIINLTTHPLLGYERGTRSGRNEISTVDLTRLQTDKAVLADIREAANKIGHNKTLRALDSMDVIRSGDYTKPLPSFMVFTYALRQYLADNPLDGWLYVVGSDGLLYPEAITEISYKHPRDRDDVTEVHMRTAFRGYEYERSNNGRVSRGGARHVFKPRDVVNRRIADILADNGLFKETAELRESFAKSFKRYQDLVQDGFTQQYRVTGRLLFSTTNNGRTQVPGGVENRKVIHDLENTRDDLCFENPAFDVPAHGDAVPVPVHPIARVFDLKTHGFCWVNADFMTPYVYDEALRDKLVLPETHRDLLDVLTTDLDVLTSDIIEGKTAGNIILAVGKPGLGKTLSAEVYTEITHKPLYSVRSGELGTTVESVSKGLSELFQRCKRWGAVLLLDEADVFVMRRDDNIDRNAIVAEFLRTLEYFDGLMFMTSNREHDIDEAVIQRCAAIIRYGAPDEAHVRQIWAVMEELFKVKLGEQLIDQLIVAFPSIAPRDMKMVMRLAIRYATKKECQLSLDVFTTCALFRNIAVHSDREPSLQHGSQTRIKA